MCNNDNHILDNHKIESEQGVCADNEVGVTHFPLVRSRKVGP